MNRKGFGIASLLSAFGGMINITPHNSNSISGFIRIALRREQPKVRRPKAHRQERRRIKLQRRHS